MAHLGPPRHVEVWSEEQEFLATVWGWCEWLKETVGVLSSTRGQSSLAKNPLDPILSFFFFFLTASLGSRGHKIHINHIQTEASRSAFKVTHTVSMSILEMV